MHRGQQLAVKSMIVYLKPQLKFRPTKRYRCRLCGIVDTDKSVLCEPVEVP